MNFNFKIIERIDSRKLAAFYRIEKFFNYCKKIVPIVLLCITSQFACVTNIVKSHRCDCHPWFYLVILNLSYYDSKLCSTAFPWARMQRSHTVAQSRSSLTTSLTTRTTSYSEVALEVALQVSLLVRLASLTS